MTMGGRDILSPTNIRTSLGLQGAQAHGISQVHYMLTDGFNPEEYCHIS